MSLPEEDRRQFPAAQAIDLADHLEQLAARLTTAVDARLLANTNMPEFEGHFADEYRQMLHAHAADTARAVDLLRRTAGGLRAASEEHFHHRRLGL